ncbi:30S ribosomal protein S16 [bacterium]|nr:30S ribosomal protein S16 [bacterium]
MATIIKLMRKGTIHRPFWRIVVTDSRKPRGCVEQLGTYDNLRKPIKLNLNEERAAVWLSRGAKPSETVGRIFMKKGIMKKAAELKPAGKKA